MYRLECVVYPRAYFESLFRVSTVTAVSVCDEADYVLKSVEQIMRRVGEQQRVEATQKPSVREEQRGERNDTESEL